MCKMVNINKNYRREKTKYSFRAILTTLFLILILNLMAIPLISAATFDNTISFDEKIGNYGKVTIKDWFGLQNLAELELKENTDTCGSSCSAETEIIMHQDGVLIDDIRFMFLNDGVNWVQGNLKSYKLYIKTGEEVVDVDEKEFQCSNGAYDSKNNSYEQVCNWIKVGTIKKTKDVWEEYTLGQKVDAGTYYIKLEGSKKIEQVVDWQITSQGKLIDDWATWTGIGTLDVGLVAYYPMEEDAGTANSTVFAVNLSAIAGTPTYEQTGKVNFAYDFTTDNEMLGNLAGILPIGDEARSISVWVKKDTATGNQGVVGLGNAVAPDRSAFSIIFDSSKPSFLAGGGDFALFSVAASDATWYHLVVTYDGTTIVTYVNGTNYVNNTPAGAFATADSLEVGGYVHATTGDLDGLVDEIGIWNRTLTTTEVQGLWNEGAGITWAATVTTTTPTVVLSSPLNKTTFNSASRIFNATINASTDNKLRNATISIFYSNGTYFNRTSKNITGDSNVTTFNITSFKAGSFIWNIRACQNDSTEAVSCGQGDNNWTFNWQEYAITGEKWVNITTEGNTNKFDLNITLNPSNAVSSALLIYNNTQNTATFDVDGLNVAFTKSVIASSVNSQQNISFYWSIKLNNGGIRNTTVHNQTVRNLGIDNCSTNTIMIFNFSLVDEDTQIKLDGSAKNTSMKLDLDLSNLAGSNIVNFSRFYNQTSYAAVCLETDLGTSRFRTDILVEYKADNRFTEFYNIQNYTLTNTTGNQNITLYNLNSSLGQEFKITYKDSNFNTVPNAIIQIQRQYIDEGVFKTVEVPKISSAGYTIAHLIRNDIVYNLIILKEGRVLDAFNNIVANCQTPALQDCEININSFGSTVAPGSFSNLGGFSSSLDYDKDTRTISSIFTIASGVSSTTTLNATLYDGLGSTNVCTDSLYATGGALSCVVPANFGNASVIVRLYNDGVQKRMGVIRLDTDPSNIYGASLVFLALSVILFIIGISITDEPKYLAFMLIIGTIIIAVLNIVTFDAWIGTGATMLWLVIALIIVMIKGANR